MENNNDKPGFKYTYSAKDREEIKRIRQKYQPQEYDGMQTLRRLDAKATEKATIVSLILGILGMLLLGTGMSIIMTDLGHLLGLSYGISLILGSIVGLLGIGMASLAYPAYRRVLKKERERIAPEILRLTEKLLQ